MHINLKTTCEAMPNQIEGRAFGVRIYFRARRGEYVLRTIDGDLDKKIADGVHESAGWWTKRTALKKCKRAIYSAKKNGLLNKARF